MSKTGDLIDPPRDHGQRQPHDYQQEAAEFDESVARQYQWFPWWRRLNWPNSIQAVSSAVVTVLTVVLAIYAGAQVRQAGRQVDAMRDQIMAAERAWVTVKAVVLSDSNWRVGLKPIVQIEFQNTGHSPALEVQVRPVGFITAGLGPAEQFPLTGFDKGADRTKFVNLSRSVVGPSTSRFAMLNFDTNDYVNGLTQPMVDSIADGKKRIYVVGVINYNDIFKRHHTTVFCFQTHQKLPSLGECPKWNTAD